jgi:hypothetical protein
MDFSETVCVISHRRSGTHLTIDNVIANFSPFSQYQNLDSVLEEPANGASDSVSEIKQAAESGPMLLKSHFLPSLVPYEFRAQAKDLVEQIFSEARIIYVARNGLDVMASLYEYMKVFDETVQSSDFSSFLRSEHSFSDVSLNRSAFWSHHVESWLDSTYRDQIILVQFEQWANEFNEVLDKLERHLGRSSRFWRTNMHVDSDTPVKSLLRRYVPSILPERTSVELRKGTSGDFENYFARDDMGFFMKHAGSTLTRLNYDAPV